MIERYYCEQCHHEFSPAEWLVHESIVELHGHPPSTSAGRDLRAEYLSPPTAEEIASVWDAAVEKRAEAIIARRFLPHGDILFTAADLQKAWMSGYDARLNGTPFEVSQVEAERYADAILSVARQSDSRPAPGRAETEFDSPATDQPPQFSARLLAAWQKAWRATWDRLREKAEK